MTFHRNIGNRDHILGLGKTAYQTECGVQGGNEKEGR